ncbi:uncharacterized protein LOC108682559 [Hyalella azteca]|uniref:Uncharacterized protein LOC108682559 n=1 Tax=Hyalella azteca TaxID=294128 RepID=A0A8B7PM32_HYAAZ|nr:uncharacterized protein LOC108682559 [Hyalella azteca]
MDCNSLPTKQKKTRYIVLPAWLKNAISTKQSEASSSPIMSCVTEIYGRALGLVECSHSNSSNNNFNKSPITDDGNKSNNGETTEWVDTNRVSLLLLRTGLHANVLAILWELVNCSRTGQLSRNECAGLLALIALVQSGQHLVSAEVLEKLQEPVVPVLDHPALIPFIQQFQQLKLQQQKIQQDLKQLQEQQQQPFIFQDPSKIYHKNTLHSTAMQSVNWLAPEGTACTAVASSNANDVDDFDDFVGAPPLNKSAIIATGIKPMAGVQQSGSFLPQVTQPQHTVITQASNFFSPQISQAQRYSTTLAMNSYVQGPLLPSVTVQTKSFPLGVDKCMNLPHVGCSPKNSPSQSYDNSAEDDFDDFQSATSETPGMLSSDGSPRSIHQTLNVPVTIPSTSNTKCELEYGNATFTGAEKQTSSLTDQFANFSIFNATQSCKKDSINTSSQLLKPDKLTSNSTEDRYAALRIMDFEDDTSINNQSASSSNVLKNSIADDSFGEFCSANKSFTDDNFGDFTCVTLPAPTNTVCTFAPNFDAGFSNMTLPTSAQPDIIKSNTTSNKAAEVTSIVKGSTRDPCSQSTAGVKYPSVSLLSTGSSSLIRSQNLPNTDSSTIRNLEKNTSSGPSDWSDIFGVLHDKPQSTSSSKYCEDLPLPTESSLTFAGFTEEPPSFPKTACDEFGDFVLADGGDLPQQVLNANFHNHGEAHELSGSPHAPVFLTSHDNLNFCASHPEENVTKKPSHVFTAFEHHSDAAPSPIEMSSSCQQPPPISSSTVGLGQLNMQKDLSPAADVGIGGKFDSVEPNILSNSNINEPGSIKYPNDAHGIDRYQSLREDSEFLAGSKGCGADGVDAAAECWKRCLQGCHQLLTNAFDALQPLGCLDSASTNSSSTSGHEELEPPMDWKRIASTTQMKEFIAGVKEVAEVTRRLRSAARRLPCHQLTATLDACALLCSQLSTLLQPLQVDNLLSEEDVPSSPSSCSICLTSLVTSSAASFSLAYGGNEYHSGCANLWLNCVDLMLPSISPA